MQVLGNFYSVVINSNKSITSDVFILNFDRFFEFVPGQWIGIKIKDNDEPRLYSIASGIYSTEVSIIYKIRPHGKLTSELTKLKSGDEIQVSAPYGKFKCSTDKGWWIATGTGIAPFKSMLDSGLGLGKKLIFGGKNRASFYFSESFEKLFGENYFRCCTGETDNDFYKGRVTDFISKKTDLPLDEKYYLCGSSEMVVDVRDILILKGIPFQNIIAEVYF